MRWSARYVPSGARIYSRTGSRKQVSHFLCILGEVEKNEWVLEASFPEIFPSPAHPRIFLSQTRTTDETVPCKEATTPIDQSEKFGKEH